jgi:hypothetical protein
MQRYWINAPSKNYKAHYYHGINVWADMSKAEYGFVQVFACVETERRGYSFHVPVSALSEGWIKEQPIYKHPIKCYPYDWVDGTPRDEFSTICGY